MPAKQNSVLRFFKRIIFAVIFVVGLFFCVLYVGDRLLGLVVRVQHRFIPASQLSPLNMPVFKDKPWAKTYWQDERASTATLAWHPYVYWRRGFTETETVNIDTSGIRKTWLPDSPPVDGQTLRIWAFGGSTMWGNGSPDDETIPSHLAKQLAAENIYAEVVNFGELGYVTTQNLIMLQRALMEREKPDIVIFYDGFNDTFSAYQQRQAGLTMNEFRRRFEFNLRFRKDDLLADTYRTMFPSLSTLTGRAGRIYTNLVSDGEQVGPAMEALPHGPYPMTDDEYAALAADVIKHYGANLEYAAQTCRENDIAFFAYWQPSIFHKSPLTETEQMVATAKSAAFPKLQDMYAQTETLLHSSALMSKLWFKDIAETFMNDPDEHFYDEIHIDTEGNKEIAKILSRDIVASMREKL